MAITSVLWAAGTVVAFRRRRIDSTDSSVRAFDAADRIIRIALAAAFVGLGAWSLTGDGPLLPTWLAWKATLFGLIIVAGLWIRIAVRRYRPALTALLEHGESPDRLEAVNVAIRGVYPAVLAVWTGLVVMVVLSVARP